MRRKISTSFLSMLVGTMFSLSAIYSGIGVAKADSVIATIPVGSAPTGVASDSTNGNLYVANHADDTLSVISGQTNTVIGNPIAVRSGPVIFGIAFDSSNGNLYVANFGAINSGGGDSVSVVSGKTNTVVGNPIPVGRSPEGVTFDPANGNLYVANRDSNTVSGISGQTNTVIGNPVVVGPGPVGIAFDPDNGNLYVTNSFGTTVSIVSGQTNTVVGNPIPVGTNPRGIAYDSANGNLYVDNCGSNTVSVISGQTNTVVGNPIPVGNCPAGIAYDSANGNLYVNNEGSNTVSVISGQTNTVVGSPINIGREPYWIAFDSDNGDLYVTNIQDNTVSVIAPSHSTTLTLNTIANVPSGTKITVTGKLTDKDASNTGVGGKTITFTGTGAGNIAPVTTNPNGTYTAIGTAPSSVATGWTVQAHYAGDSSYRASDSAIQSYNTISTTPPNTTITSAVDGNGATITNGSTTFSSSIRFTFTATAGTNPVASFQCSLDNSAFSSCSSPATFTNLAAGKHIFQVKAVDTSGNTDPTPARFSWTITTVTPPTKTTITSAVDGNGATVQNGGTTTSSSIKIAFTATPGTNPIAGFQCSLDNSPFSSCNSPATFNDLAAGPHKFTVVAVDTAGNKDPNPATFGWTILTPAQAIQQLIQLKHSMHLDPTTDRTLDIRLNIGLQFAQNNIKSGTCLQLTVFINQVQAALRIGQVTSTQATQLIQGAQNIQTALGCTGSANGIVGSPSAQSSLNSTQSQQQPQITASSQPLLQPSPYTYQYRYPSQLYQSQPSQAQLIPPTANPGISQTVNENSEVTLDGRTSHPEIGGTIVGYQWTQLPTGVPVVMTGANTATPTFTAPIAPTDTILAFGLRVLDNHGAVSTNPAIIDIVVKHNPNNGPTTGGNTPGTTIIQPQQHQPLPNSLLRIPLHPNPRIPQIGSFQP